MGRCRQEPPAAANRHVYEILKNMHFVMLLPLIAIPGLYQDRGQVKVGGPSFHTCNHSGFYAASSLSNLWSYLQM